jgi:hypothetical protein
VLPLQQKKKEKEKRKKKKERLGFSVRNKERKQD